MIRDENIVRLFRAHAEQQSRAFQSVAEVIIREALASNNHSLATQLQKALITTNGKAQPKRSNAPSLSSLPTDRRNGESLIEIHESQVSEDQIVLMDSTRCQILRILEEHHQKRRLAEFGYAPKNKILFWGPPGCGKTHTASYLAHELGLPLGTVQLNAIISSYLGDTASHIQRVFDLAARSPMVLLLDEIDSIAKQRDDPNDVGELKRIVNSLLQAMDQFHSTESIVVAASNHQYLLDPAVWRRFDDIIRFPLPGKKERDTYLRTLLNGVELRGSIPNVSKSLTALSFADIKKIATEAVKTALLRGEAVVSTSDILEQCQKHKRAIEAAIHAASGNK